MLDGYTNLVYLRTSPDSILINAKRGGKVGFVLVNLEIDKCHEVNDSLSQIINALRVAEV